MSTNYLETITESFSDIEKDIWNIVTKRINLDQVPDAYLDELSGLIRRVIVNIAPLFEPETYQQSPIQVDTSLNVKSMTGDTTPIVNYIEAAVIEADLWGYLKTNKTIASHLKENRLFSRYLQSMVINRNGDDPELAGITTSAYICLKTVDLHYYRSPSEVSVETKNMMEEEFKTKTTWTAEEQQRTIRRLKAKQPMSFSRHNWHFMVIDFIEWYCLKNNMDFYLTKDLYLSSDAQTVSENEEKATEGECLINGIAGRMLMHVQRYGTSNADDTLKRYAKILQSIQKYRKDLVSVVDILVPFTFRRKSLHHPSIATISEIAVDLTLLMEDADAKDKEDRLYDLLDRLMYRNGQEQFIAFYTEMAGITGIKPSHLDELKKELEENHKYKVKMSCKETIVNCYLTTYSVIGFKKAQEAKEDVFGVLKEFNEYDREKYLVEENRKVLYNNLKEAFEMHLDKEIAEVAAYSLFRSLMSAVPFLRMGISQDIMEEYQYRRAFELIESSGFHPKNLILNAELKYAEIIRGFGFEISPIKANRTAEVIQKESWTLKRVIEDRWTKESHEILHDIIKDILKENLLSRPYLSLDNAATDTLYLAVCNDFDVAPMV